MKRPMTLSLLIILLVIGLLAGYLSGLIGIGGGVIIVPALVFILGYSQIMAQGTTLALMVPPIGILAAYTYYQKGAVDIKTALIITLGFVLGSFWGGKTAVYINENILRKIFSMVIILIGIKMFFMKK